jgi:hypothetical protein
MIVTLMGPDDLGYWFLVLDGSQWAGLPHRHVFRLPDSRGFKSTRDCRCLRKSADLAWSLLIRLFLPIEFYLLAGTSQELVVG